ncbi:NAD(P)H-dependent oxidoreductase [Zhongshania marina]|uniref:NAD(P)H dehydrogenase n=1 Tax=Zhongshania marina TaxID=2304603 RepID=A0A2S4HKH8_9GAMM|nr:NAD(P)H-dependent oxidoreductase [Marortus luteolus]POP54505.1 NAD(P)H dehydrogenase [Marortus luteolus]
MNVLIVHAHPEPKSFSSALFREAVHQYRRQGHTVQVSDLYSMNFNPVASAADFSTPINSDYLNYALEQRHAMSEGTIAPDIAQEVDKVITAELILFNFPLYWFSVPAILKGWIDRVFVSGKFYGGKRIYTQGGMLGKKVLVSVTTGGRSDMLDEGGIHGDLTGILKPLLQGSLGYVGMEVYEPFYAFHVPYLKDEKRQRILDDWGNVLTNLEQRPILDMPDLEHFDDRFYPIQQ